MYNSVMYGQLWFYICWCVFKNEVKITRGAVQNVIFDLIGLLVNNERQFEL